MFYIDVILKVPYQWLTNKLQHSGYQLDTKHFTTEIRLFNLSIYGINTSKILYLYMLIIAVSTAEYEIY